MTCKPIASQRLGKHIPAEANARNNKTSTATQGISKHSSLTIEVVFSVWSVQSGYKEEYRSWQEQHRISSCQELVRVLELAAAEWQEKN
jgi:hypothetical protein